MKKIIISLIAISSIIISGCGDNTSFEFEFDNFYWNFNTNNTFEINNSETKWLAAWLLKNDIIATYIQTENPWYTDSIIVIKKTSSQTLEEFIAQNTKKIKLDWYTSQKAEEKTLKCNDNKITTQTIDSELEWNLNITFFTQTFFIYSWSAYIISFSSENEQERDTFTSDIKNIKCKLIEK